MPAETVGIDTCEARRNINPFMGAGPHRRKEVVADLPASLAVTVIARTPRAPVVGVMVSARSPPAPEKLIRVSATTVWSTNGPSG